MSQDSEPEILGETTFNHNQTNVPKDIQKLMGLQEGDKLLWGRNKRGEFVLMVGVTVKKDVADVPP